MLKNFINGKGIRDWNWKPCSLLKTQGGSFVVMLKSTFLGWCKLNIIVLLKTFREDSPDILNHLFGVSSDEVLVNLRGKSIYSKCSLTILTSTYTRIKSLSTKRCKQRVPKKKLQPNREWTGDRTLNINTPTWVSAVAQQHLLKHDGLDSWVLEIHGSQKNGDPTNESMTNLLFVQKSKDGNMVSANLRYIKFLCEYIYIYYY